MKGVIKNMKEQFLNLSGLTELVTYIKLCIAQHKMIIPRASFSLFPKTGDENNIYIDTSTNSIYRWNDSDKSFVLLAKPPRNISISEGKNNGQITLKVDEIESNATVHGLLLLLPHLRRELRQIQQFNLLQSPLVQIMVR